MILPRIDPFIKPYVHCKTRVRTTEEAIEAYKLTGVFSLNEIVQTTKISTGQEAANHVCSTDLDNGLSNHIEHALKDNNCYSAWLQAMPSKTPTNLKHYKNNYQTHNATLVDSEINSYGAFLSPEQVLFHGGLWPLGNPHDTTRPLSTTLCPSVALRNALYKGKAYDANRIDLMVLTVKSSVTKAFAYKKNMRLGHEKEVLFASGARLTLISEKLIRPNYRACNEHHCKDVPIYVQMIEIN